MIRLSNILSKKILIQIYENMTEWFWPEICPFCGKASRQGICDVCRKELDYLKVKEPRCMQCGKPIRHAEAEYCRDCMHTHHYYEKGLSLWLHQAPVSTSVYQFKYHNQRRFGEIYAEELVRQYSSVIQRWKPDVIIPIPLHRKRRRKRGFNQAEILANQIGRKMNLPVDKKMLFRICRTKPQKTLSHRERKENLKHAFAIVPGSCKVRRVLLIDDIYTTGNTIDAAAEILRKSGVEKVYFLTISIGQGY